MMPVIEIIRVESTITGTFGILTIQKQAFCVTLELPDRLNQANASAIPALQYLCRKVISPKFGKTYQVLDVPDRSHILFHGGNTIHHTRGCILLGEHFGKLKGDRAILNSGKTFKKFIQTIGKHTDFHLTIREVF